MLVLSRKPQEKIVFPNLGIVLEIIRVAGGKVRIGVDAPADIPVLRGEIASRDTSLSATDAPGKSREHELRNRLYAARLGLKLLEKQLAAGMIVEAEATLAKALGIFKQLDCELASKNSGEVAAAGRRALIVEDDPNEAELLSGILRMSGYYVTTASDGLEALKLLEKDLPDFVLLDMNMPRCDGRSALHAIRSNPALRDLPIYAVSGSSQREVGVTVGADGVNRWFQKPLDPEVLIDAMRAPIDTHCLSA